MLLVTMCPTENSRALHGISAKRAAGVLRPDSHLLVSDQPRPFPQQA